MSSEGVVWIEGTKYLNICGGKGSGRRILFFHRLLSVQSTNSSRE